MVQTGDDGVVEDRETLANGLGGIVQESVEVRVVGQSETCDTLLCAVDDEVCAIRKRFEWMKSARLSISQVSVQCYIRAIQVMTRFDG